MTNFLRGALSVILLSAILCASSLSVRAAAPDHIEASFALPVTGNPFDFTENDVQVTFHARGVKDIVVPAFFDGGTLWRVRATPPKSGTYALVKVTRNGIAASPQSFSGRAFPVAPSKTGFVRRDPKDAHRFRFDDGLPYYPLGHNSAWANGQRPDVPTIFGKMGAAGENWSRVWMNHWDEKNLDWDAAGQPPLGQLNLDVARKWDGIVDAAGKNGIYFQMTLQHHGQYSSTVNSNWGENPWNAKNPGGFLQTPGAFFTDEKAKALTRAKYRYIVARWGYSPHVLAWELFNEVQFTDALREDKNPAAVAAWHKEMAAFLRAQDINKHLVVTSSDLDIPGLYDAMDYYQPHSYPPDPLSALASLVSSTRDKPIFFGETGPSGQNNAAFLHRAVWASLVSSTSGASEFWDWDIVDRENLYGEYKAASAFLRQTGLPKLAGLKPVKALVKTDALGTSSFAPGGGWGAAKQTAFTLEPDGRTNGAETLPSFLQGKAHPELFTFGEFSVNYPQAGTFSVVVRQAAKGGAHVTLSVDGTMAAEQDFPAAAQDSRTNARVTAQIPAGKHVIRLENTGADWAVVNRIELTPYGPTLRALGKANGDVAAFWIENAQTNGTPQAGTVSIPGLRPGTYKIQWWDTKTGKISMTTEKTVDAGQPLELSVAPVTQDAAVFVKRGPSR